MFHRRLRRRRGRLDQAREGSAGGRGWFLAPIYCLKIPALVAG
jgi:hypothetical protein